jgi:hypothetical protein
MVCSTYNEVMLHVEVGDDENEACRCSALMQGASG